MKTYLRLFTLTLLFTLTTAACSGIISIQTDPQPEMERERQSANNPQGSSAESPVSSAKPATTNQSPMAVLADIQDMNEWPTSRTLRDNQGAVDVQVTPVNLNEPIDILEFQVSLDTHSVDLSMDLVELAWLKTDTGLVVQASSWEAPLGGHHVSGTLSFPSNLDGKALLDGVLKIELLIVNLEVAERSFIWER
jgi:hypothetical protein